MWFGVLLLVASLAVPVSAFAALTDGLEAYWELGSTSDAHGANHLTNNNAATFAGGKVGNAVDLEMSSTQYFSIADNASLSTGDVDFSAALWVNLESKPAQTMIIATKGQGAHTFEWNLSWRSDTDRFRFDVCGATSFGSCTTVSATTLGAPSTSTWYFIVIRHNATANTISIQVDDGTVDSASHTAGSWDGGGEFQIGNMSLLALPFDGLVDQFGFWKKVLTSDEGTSLHNSSNGLSYIDLVGAGPTVTNMFRRRHAE